MLPPTTLMTAYHTYDYQLRGDHQGQEKTLLISKRILKALLYSTTRLQKAHLKIIG